MTATRTEIDRERLLRGTYELNEVPQYIYDEPKGHLYGYSRLNKLGKIYTPILDQNVPKHDLPRWPDNHSFAVCLTHDVDHVTAYSPRQTSRQLLRTVRENDGLNSLDLAGKLVRTSGKFVRDSIKKTTPGLDPYHCYEQWLEMEAEVGARSTFFFMPNKIHDTHITDNDYRFDDPVVFDGTKQEVRDMIAEIYERGWEIGVHPTWSAATNESELRRQKKQIESIIDTDVVSVRQHYLHFDLEQTPSIHDSVGLKYDSSLGFNANIGFRFGTSCPWQLYDWAMEDESGVLEIPLVIQDVSLFRSNKGLNLNKDMAIEYIKTLSSKIKSVGGVLTLSWHPSYINKQEWMSVYKQALNHLRKEGAWFATVKQIGEWWEKHEQ